MPPGHDREEDFSGLQQAIANPDTDERSQFVSIRVLPLSSHLAYDHI